MTTPKTTDRPAKMETPPVQQSAGELTTIPLRLPYPKGAKNFGIDHAAWKVLVEAIWPSAKTPEAVFLAISYCKARNLDPMKRPIHIVPVYSSQLKKEVETIWPGIAELRTTAARTGQYAGIDAVEFGPNVTEDFIDIDTRNDAEKERLENFVYPEWAQVTVYRLIAGVRCAFVGPKVFWKEAYATKGHFSTIPNEMWKGRPHGQLGKCAEAAALRVAFPEELGNEYSAEEIAGRVIDGEIASSHYAGTPIGETMTPPRPKKSDFDRDQQPGPQQQARTYAEQAPPAPPPPEPEPEPESEPEPEEAGPSPGWNDAEEMLAKVEASIKGTENLDELRKHIRNAIDALGNIIEDEREILRSRFNTMLLEEQRRRGPKRKGR